jgi:Icc-related predicted phosphoesterase
LRTYHYRDARTEILLVSGLHCSLRQLDWIVDAAGDYDLVVIAGDLLSLNSAVEPVACGSSDRVGGSHRWATLSSACCTCS